MMNPYERVELSRECTAATFPLPTSLDCIRYAITELAEYDDALLRLERAGDKRNNARQPDPQAELGQAIYMLLSAATRFGERPEYQPWLSFGMAPGTVYLNAMRYTLLILEYLQAPSVEGVQLMEAFGAAYSHMLGIAVANDIDFMQLIHDTCAAFEAKHGTVAL